MRRKEVSAFFGSLAVTTALAGCSQPKYTEEDLKKKYEAPNTVIYGLDDWMAEDISVYTTFSGTIVEKKDVESESGVINYIFKCKLDNGQDFSENVDQYTYFEFNVGDNVEITTKKIIYKDTDEIVSTSSYTKYTKAEKEIKAEKER